MGEFHRSKLPDAQDYFENRGLKLKGPRSAKWKTTRCEFHEGSDSMRVNVQSGGFCCMNCGVHGGDVLAYEIQITGAEFQVAAKSLGCWEGGGKEPSRQYKSSALSPRQALSVLAFESTLIAVAGANLARGVTLTASDLARVLLAAGRVNHIESLFQ